MCECVCERMSVSAREHVSASACTRAGLGRESPAPSVGRRVRVSASWQVRERRPRRLCFLLRPSPSPPAPNTHRNRVAVQFTSTPRPVQEAPPGPARSLRPRRMLWRWRRAVGRPQLCSLPQVPMGRSDEPSPGGLGVFSPQVSLLLAQVVDICALSDIPFLCWTHVWWPRAGGATEDV